MKYHFENLEVYQLSVSLTKEIYSIAKKLPKIEEYALKQQLIRAVTSIVLNIAEGSGKRTLGEKTNYISVALGSLQETIAIIKLMVDLEELSGEDVLMIEELEEKLYFKLIAFKKSLKTF